MVLPQLHISLERWKFYKPLRIYVSTHGRIKNIDGDFIVPKIDPKGYVKIVIDDKHYLVHRLVLLTWYPISNPERMTVDHLNHNKRDNSVKNLEWVTPEENLRRAVADASKIYAGKDVHYIMSTPNLTVLAQWLIAEQGMLGTEPARIERRISQVINKPNKTYCGYHFIKQERNFAVFK
jgi:hypothetical protein